MTVREMIQWAREWNFYHQFSPKRHGAEKRKQLLMDKARYQAKKAGYHVKR